METIETGQRSVYANLTNDYMFKRIFGSEECKDILINFLNRIVGNGRHPRPRAGIYEPQH